MQHVAQPHQRYWQQSCIVDAHLYDQDARIDPLKREAIKRFKADYTDTPHAGT